MAAENNTHTQPQLDGSDADMAFMLACKDMSPAGAKRCEKLLASEPDDLRSRLALLGYYGIRPAGWDKYLEHMLWVIDNRPTDYVSGWLGHEYRNRPMFWTKERERAVASAWVAKTTKHPKDARVICNAASFFRWHDPPTSQRLYKRAKRLAPTLALPARKLALQYRALARETTGKDRTNLLRRALQEADEAIKRRDRRAERVSILWQFTPLAIHFGKLELAERFARRLRYYGQVGDLWNQYAYLLSAWIDFRNNRRRALKFKLAALRQSFRRYPSHVACSFAAVSFVQDVLARSDEQLAHEILKILILGSREEEELARSRSDLKEWSKAIRDKREPELVVLREKLERGF